MLKSEDEAWAMFENLSNNSRQQASNKRREPAPKAPKTESLYEVGHPSDMSTQVVESITKVDAITKKLDQIMIAGFSPNTAHTSTQLESCSFCSSTMHHVNDCPTAGNYTDVSHEQVNAAFSRPGNDPYSNTYNRGGEIIPTSHGRIQLWETQPRGSTLKFNLAGCPINRLQHIGLHNSSTKLPHCPGQNLILKIEC
jgi:hypothetical protein